MKKYLPILFFFVFGLYNVSLIYSQCTPDTSCHPIGNSGNICPASLDSGTVGVPYNKVITFIPPDSATVGTTSLALCRILLNGITGLPPGLTYSSNPSNGQFNVTTPFTRYCIQISGTPTSPGSYKIHISVTPYTPLLSSCISTFQTVIDSSVTMVINSATGVRGLSDKSNNLTCTQNPFSNTTTISYFSNKQEPVELKVRDMLGNTVYSEKILAGNGQNIFKFNGIKLRSGMYMYSVTNNKNIIVKKLIKSNY